MNIAADHALHLLDISCRLFDNACQYRIINLFCHSDFVRINVNNSLKIHHHIGENLDISCLVLSFHPQIRNCAVLDRICDFAGDLCSFFSYNFACNRTYHIFCKNTAFYTVFQHQFLIKLIASYFCQIITPGIKEHTCNQTLCTVHRKRLAGTDFFIQL